MLPVTIPSLLIGIKIIVIYGRRLLSYGLPSFAQMRATKIQKSVRSA